MIKTIPVNISDLLEPPKEKFQYFESAASHPFQHTTRDYQTVNAWWLAEHSLLAYANYDFVEKTTYSATSGRKYAFYASTPRQRYS